MEDKSIRDIAGGLLAGLEPQMAGEFTASYSCPCSRSKLESVLLSLGEKDLGDMAASAEDTEINCDFCRNAYVFKPGEISKLLAKTKTH